MKLIAVGIVAFFIFMAIRNGSAFGIESADPASSSLPLAQVTAIHASAVATKAAGDAAYNSAVAQANVDATEAARVYIQAQNDEANKRRVVATEQALQATRVSNDDAVSKQYATLAAVSIQATAEAISQTIETNRIAYAAQQAAIQATRQATTNETIARAEQVGKQKDDSDFWSTFWKIVVITIFVLLVATAIILMIRIPTRVEVEEVEVPVVRHSMTEADPVANKLSGLVFTSADPRVLLTNIVLYSGRQIGWRQQRIAGADEIGASNISDRAWGNAIEWGKKHYDLATQRGPVKNGGGTYSQQPLSELHNRLVLDPPFDDAPTPPSA